MSALPYCEALLIRAPWILYSTLDPGARIEDRLRGLGATVLHCHRSGHAYAPVSRNSRSWCAAAQILQAASNAEPGGCAPESKYLPVPQRTKHDSQRW